MILSFWTDMPWQTVQTQIRLLLKANSADPDQTAPLGAVWSGSALFAQAYLSKNLGSLRYIKFKNSFNIWFKHDFYALRN